MSRLDDRLTYELEHAARPADPTQVFERVDRKRARRAIARRLQAGGLVVVVLAGTIGGFAFLSKTFRDPTAGIGGTVSPAEIEPRVNGRIVVAQRSQGGPLQLVSVNPDGSGRIVIPTNVDGASDSWLPAWSPDGTRLAVAMSPAGYGPLAIWVMNADGSGPIKIAEGTNVYQPSWSPDGTRIAYAADSADGSAIHVVNADGSGDHIIGERLLKEHYYSASFSPDGTQILYDAGTDSRFDIFVMSMDGTNTEQLTTTGTDYSPSWSPDGSQIAFARRGHEGGSDVYVMDADGSNVRQLTEGGAGVTNRNPTWSPDGTTIAYHGSLVIDGPGSVVVMNPDGSHPVTILNEGVLGFSWQPLPTGAIPAPAVVDLGPGFPVCNVQSMSADFDGNGSSDTAYLASKMSDGGCPLPGTSDEVLEVDLTGDGLADVSYGPLQCDAACRTFGTPDLDGDGRADIAIIQQDHPVDFVSTYRIVHPGSDQVAVAPFATADTTATHAFVDFPWGSNAEGGGGAYCGSQEEGTYRLAVWTASPNPDGTYAVTQDLYVATGGSFHFVSESNDPSVPQDQLPEGGGSTFCGVPVTP